MANKRRRSQANKKAQTPGWLLGLGGVVAGLLLATLLFIGTDSDQLPLRGGDNGAASDSAGADIELESPRQSETAAEQQRDYEFYDRLEQDQQQAPSSSQQRENSVPPEAKQRYLIQAGAFTKRADAEQLKARLAFLGLSARINDARINDRQWYRVQLGPYEGKRAAEVDVRALRENNFEAQLRRVID